MDKDVIDQLSQDLRKAGISLICLAESPNDTSDASLAVTARCSSGDIIKEELIKLVTTSEKGRYHK